MKALVYTSGSASNVTLEDMPKPTLPAGGALAKILSTSICGTDIRTFRFGSTSLIDKRIVGHEACYLLEQVDPAAGDFKVGDRVIIAPAIGCGECFSCKRGHTNTCENMKTIGFQYDGTFSEYCAIPAQAFKMNNVIKLSEQVGDAEASVVEPIACAINGQSFLAIDEYDTVLIFGAGYLGCIHAELAQISGAKKVMLADISAKRREQAAGYLQGVDILDSGAPDFMDTARKLAGSTGINVLITACPAGIAHKQALELAYRHGRISLFGGLPGDATGFLDSNLIHYKELGVFGVHASTAQQNREALSLIESGKLKPYKYLSFFPLEQVYDALKQLQSEDATKVILSN